jgi:Icc protein
MLKLIQVSDSHFTRDASRLRSCDCDSRLENMLAMITELNPDLLLATGDLSHDGSRASYRRLRTLLTKPDRPVILLPGNHDDLTEMALHLQGGALSLLRPWRQDRWQILPLDTTIPYSVAGKIGAEELNRLDRWLNESEGMYTVVALHHPPAPVGSAWIDNPPLSGSDQLLSLATAARGVRAIVAGHVHQSHRQDRNGVAIVTAPSTCFQFLPGSESMAIEDRPPACLLYELSDDGGVATRRVSIDPDSGNLVVGSI